MLGLLARLARGALPLSDLRDDADREALSLAMQRREVLLSAVGGVAYVVRSRRP